MISLYVGFFICLGLCQLHFEYNFVSFSYCRTDTLDGLKRALPRIEKELSDARKFKDLYQFTFNFAKNPEQKGLGMSLRILFK